MTRIVKQLSFHEHYLAAIMAAAEMHPHALFCHASRRRPIGTPGCVCLGAMKAREVVEIEKSRRERAERNRKADKSGSVESLLP